MAAASPTATSAERLAEAVVPAARKPTQHEPTPQKPAARPRKADPRRRVLDAAAACFTRAGFHATSMQEICAEAGMSPGGLYRYFPSKDAIILAIVEEERSARMKMLELLHGAPSFAAGLTAMGQALFSGEMPMVCADLGPEIAAEAARNPKLKVKFDEVDEEMGNAIRDALLAGQKRGEIDPAIDPDIAMTLIDAIGDGLLLRRRLQPDLPLAAMMPGFGDLIARMLAPVKPSTVDPT
ncbi:TetR/AcrR family transcriptional regulator [Ancylobacter defluvii]|uniref:TetR family transcriptional regulator n=1 Tax=Ancylobacter defluvii TaxID=1282440 RepID=A0A9W6K0B0_9HYPH|nr:TetR/AcrR family transcriptional regulator [Ancylobacter defluvii]MBS7587082.1 TetR/AcrR family transcriptional regulator [Ancylobacter defluvii]GLK85385.1 TetR family transcriptional regulator [Ancylobacter defluvii]